MSIVGIHVGFNAALVDVVEGMVKICWVLGDGSQGFEMWGYPAIMLGIEAGSVLQY